MALITCPECGQQVSDKAQTCIHCGSPLKVDKTVKIKIFRYTSTFMFVTLKVTITDENGKVLWEGPSGSVAIFEVDKETKITLTPEKGLHTPLTGVVKPGHKYQTVNDMSKAFSLKSVTRLVEVEIIDSD